MKGPRRFIQLLILSLGALGWPLAGMTWASPQNQGPPKTLEGEWLAPCKQGKIAHMKISGGNHSLLREIFHGDSQCQTANFMIETAGHLSYPATPPSFAHHFVDYTYQDIYLIPLTQKTAEQFNRQRLCDWQEWQVWVPHIITGLGCRFFEGTRPMLIPQKGQQRFGIFAVKEPWLYFGQNNPLEDSSSPGRRPSDLQAEPFGRRTE